MLGIKLTLTDDSIRDIVGMANMPLLIFDEYWLALFPREYKNAKIKDCEMRIVDFMKEEARIREKIKLLSDKKQQAIRIINSLTTEAFKEGKKSAKLKIRKSKTVILKINAYLLLSERRLKNIEKELENTNRNLLEETIKICHGLMSESKKRIDFLEPKITQLREETRIMTEELAKNETCHQMTYNLLHKLIGADVIDQLDKAENMGKKKWFWV
ncbi:MAG: hypothetical protein FWE24_02200 [Defluviitaleaceae bacterium]|nr:hypothetical protein [Defluviitaleaceae bacterium]